MYTRWGRIEQLHVILVYERLAAGSKWDQSGEGANYILITKNPSYLSRRLIPESFHVKHKGI